MDSVAPMRSVFLTCNGIYFERCFIIAVLIIRGLFFVFFYFF